MVLATKERIIADRQFATERYILSTMPVLYLPLYRLDSGDSGGKFISADGIGHVCTVTGALISQGGRLFDATDDKITVDETTPITDIWDGGGTAAVWCNLASDGELDLGYLLTKGAWVLNVEAEAAGKVKVNFDIVTGGNDGEWITTATEVTLNAWAQVIITYNSTILTTDPIIYINGSAVGVTESIIPTGARVTDAGGDVTVGNDATQAVTTDGKIGETLLYNRILTAPEAQDIYIATN